ncbi:hypothetical protein GGX14DRAFT_464866 [Mycena pura]|uniref:Uncharacterized protein n=1 Tax=Mycena pura TaxID=153505 RepID=A0AAD6V6N2_9AGAR|nr:hypothetical protein GGX14DRAFT_464866 [Mycena pura]
MGPDSGPAFVECDGLFQAVPTTRLHRPLLRTSQTLRILQRQRTNGATMLSTKLTRQPQKLQKKTPSQPGLRLGSPNRVLLMSKLFATMSPTGFAPAINSAPTAIAATDATAPAINRIRPLIVVCNIVFLFVPVAVLAIVQLGVVAVLVLVVASAVLATLSAMLAYTHPLVEPIMLVVAIYLAIGRFAFPNLPPTLQVITASVAVPGPLVMLTLWSKFCEISGLESRVLTGMGEVGNALRGAVAAIGGIGGIRVRSKGTGAGADPEAQLSSGELDEKEIFLL